MKELKDRKAIGCCTNSLWHWLYHIAKSSATISHSSDPQRCKNVQTCEQCSCKKNPISGKIFAKFYAVLSRKGVMSRILTFWWLLLAHFGSLCVFFWHFFSLTFWLFWAFYAVLSQSRFVLIYALFWAKLFWLKLCSCKNVVFLHLCMTVIC